MASIIVVNRPKAMTSSGFTSAVEKRKTEGPGLKPPMLSAARIRKTAPTLPGMPSDSTGIRLAPETELFAASVAATPSGVPLPNGTGPLCIFCPVA